MSTYLPSWMERPPANFGSAAHGKLKADHWRTVCTVSMVITLVRLWTSSTASSGDHLLLENFVHLVIAVDLATRRSMDSERARLFDHHMLEYLEHGLQRNATVRSVSVRIWRLLGLWRRYVPGKRTAAICDPADTRSLCHHPAPAE